MSYLMALCSLLENSELLFLIPWSLNNLFLEERLVVSVKVPSRAQKPPTHVHFPLIVFYYLQAILGTWCPYIVWALFV